MSEESGREGGGPGIDGPVEEHPFRGEELGGAAATVCPGFDPEPIRYIGYQPAMKILSLFGVVVVLLAAVAFAAGYALRNPGGGWWPGLLALPFYGLGSLLALIALADVALMIAGYHSTARYFKNALLTPGVIVSSRPLTVVVLAPLGNGQGPAYQGLQRLDLRGLPYHARTPGTRVPCVSAFNPAEGLDRWLSFIPEPICWGTGRRELIDRCFERLGTGDFERLDACIARGLIPASADELILLDEDDNLLERLSIPEEEKKFGTDGGAAGDRPTVE
jgi:hypothetical protein